MTLHRLGAGRAWGFAVMAAVLSASQAGAVDVEPQINRVKLHYDVGKFEDALNIARDAIERGGATEAQLAQLHKYAGLSASNMGKEDEAERHFKFLLRIDPEVELDPFTVTPKAIKLFDKVRLGMDSELQTLRQVRELRASLRAEEEEHRRRMAQISRQVTVRTMEHRNFLVNFVPFGGGQFQQGRFGPGAVLAVTEGVFAAANATAYITLAALSSSAQNQYQTGTINGDIKTVKNGVLPQNAVQAQNWRYVKYGSAAALFGLYVGGVVDAVIHHQEIVTVGTDTKTVPGEPTPSQAPSPAPVPVPPVGHPIRASPRSPSSSPRQTVWAWA
jgi:tetratricopeptide (TPR) repeat protein